MSGRLIAFGDVHGCSLALKALLAAINPQPEDTIVGLGDYIDRGPDTKGVIEELISLSEKCNFVSLLGNHEEMLLHAGMGRDDLKFWLRCGGKEALESYGGGLNEIPREHIQFIRNCLPYYETDTHIFVHANYLPDRDISECSGHTLRWLFLSDFLPNCHVSGKTVIMGHHGLQEIFDIGHLKCIDTECYKNGWLTGMDVNSGEIWQFDCMGNPRKDTK